MGCDSSQKDKSSHGTVLVEVEDVPLSYSYHHTKASRQVHLVPFDLQSLTTMAPIYKLFTLAVASWFPIRALSAPCAVDAPLPPSKDPWYTEPPGFESAPPGSVLRIREAPGNLTSVINGSQSAWNILYRTTDSRYKPTFAVTTLFTPCKAKSNPKALLSYQIPYDSAWVDASPSYTLYDAKSVAGAEALEAILAEGWFLNVPDYEGPLASFTAGVISGHATIDSIRAVRSLHSRFGLDKDANYAMWGYSGGALASEWAAELQVQYAPEMTFAGAALGGLTPNVTSVLFSINGNVAAGLGVSAILGLGSQYPDVYEKFAAKLKTSGPYNRTEFLAAENLTLAGAAVTYAMQDLSKYFENGFDDILNEDTDKIVFNDGLMGYHGVPQMPLYVYKAIKDEISPVADTDELVDKYCNVGADVVYKRNTVGSHPEEGSLGAPGALEWLAHVLGASNSTKYPDSGCQIETVTVNGTSLDI